MLTDVDESLFSRILVYFVVKISTHLDLGYATGAKRINTDRLLGGTKSLKHKNCKFEFPIWAFG